MSKDNLNISSSKSINSDHLEQKSTSHLLPADSYASHAKSKKGLARIIKATGYSIDGFKAAYKYEAECYNSAFS